MKNVVITESTRGLGLAMAREFLRAGSRVAVCGRSEQARAYLPVYETDALNIQAIIDTNLKGMIFVTQIAARHMLEQGGGAIWNMEGLGSQGEMQTNTTLYTTTKCALTHFTRCVAKELAQTPVRIGRLSPGLVLTDLILKSPQGEPSATLDNPGFRSIINILAERPETIAAFFVPRILASRRNDDRIAWLTKSRAFRQFAKTPFVKRHLV